MFKIGNVVKDKVYGYVGIVQNIYKSWDDLKNNNRFLTIDPDDESEKMTPIEKLINGDPKDEWLKMQKNPPTKEQLHEKWYALRCIDGGGSWTCESNLEMIDYLLN